MQSSDIVGRPSAIAAVRVRGGLGNQLFQYAAGLAVARKANAKLQLDLTGFDGYERDFALSKFDIHAERSSPPRFAHGLSRRILEFRRMPLLRKILGPSDNCVVREVGQAWQELEFDNWKRLYLRGYWQSYRYFEGIEEELRRIFCPERFIDASIQQLHSEIAGSNSIAVHIRRGDYVSNSGASKTHGIIGKSWYESAASLIKQVSPQCRFEVFSDDPTTGRAIAGDWPNTRIHPSRPAEQDLALISACRHKIIANSTFSWWGAWLSNRLDGLVIAPRQWFTREKLMKTYVEDLFPQGWIRL